MADLPPQLQSDRSFTFHLTPWAPGCDGRSVGSRERNRMMAATPVRAFERLLSRLRIAPRNVAVRTDHLGDPEICRIIDRAPLCLIWHGIDTAEANVVLKHMALSGWEPAEVLPLPQPARGLETTMAA